MLSQLQKNQCKIVLRDFLAWYYKTKCVRIYIFKSLYSHSILLAKFYSYDIRPSYSPYPCERHHYPVPPVKSSPSPHL